MRSHSSLFHVNTIAYGALVSSFLGAYAGPVTAADMAHDAYSWSAELIAVGDSAGTVTLQSRLVTEANTADIMSLKMDQRATLVWSGMNWAAGVRTITAGAVPSDAHLTLPVEFVSMDNDGRYVRFRVRVPSADLAAIKSLAPGGWVTGTSPRGATTREEAVVAVRPYGNVG